MFEGHPQETVDSLLHDDAEFRQLYNRHRKLNRQCMDAELGVLAVNDATLGQMKREKLVVKQRLVRMFEDKTTH